MKNELISVQTITSELFKQLDFNNVKYCVLKGYETLPLLRKGSDIDILLLDSDWEYGLSIYVKVLNQLGFRIFQVFDHHYCLGYGIYKDQIALHIDFFKNVDFMGVTYISGDEIIRYRKWQSYFYAASVTHAGLTGWVQNILYGRTEKKKYNDRIIEALDNETDFFLEQVRGIFHLTIADELVRQFDARKFKATISLRRKIIYKVTLNRLFRHPLNTAINHFLTLYKHLIFRLKPDGVVVALIGPDGCGKTTAISKIESPLCAVQHKAEAYKFHLKPGWLPQLHRLFSPRQWRKPGPVVTTVPAPHAGKPSGRIGSLFRLIYYLIDYTLGYYVKIYPKKIRHHVVIFDRYYYDFIVDPLRMKINLPTFVMKVFLSIVPKPSVMIYLDADNLTISSRKKELTLSEIDRQRKAYEELVDSLPYAFTVDSNRQANEVGQDIVRIIFDRAAVNGRPTRAQR